MKCKMTFWIDCSPVIFSSSHSCGTIFVTWNKNLNLSGFSIESLIQPDVTLKPLAWLPLAVTNVPALNRGVQTGRHFSDFYQTEFIRAAPRISGSGLLRRNPTDTVKYIIPPLSVCSSSAHCFLSGCFSLCFVLSSRCLPYIYLYSPWSLWSASAF